MGKRYIGGIIGGVLGARVGSVPDPGMYDQDSSTYIKGLGGWIVAGRSYQFDIVSAPGPSGDTGRTIDLSTETNNAFTMPAGSTYVLSFDRPIAIDWEVLGGGGTGGNGRSGNNGPPQPGSPGSFGGDSTVTTPQYVITAGGGTGGKGGNGTDFIGGAGAPGSPGPANITFTDPTSTIPENMPGTVSLFNGNIGGGGSGGGDAPGAPGGTAPSVYTGTIGPAGGSAGGGGAGSGSPGDGMDGTGGGGGGGGGGGAYVSIVNHTANSNLTYTVVATPGNGYVRMIANGI